MKYLRSLFLFLGLLSVHFSSAQFRIWLTDSSLNNPYDVPIAGEITIKGKTISLEKYKGKYRFEKVKWTGKNCRFGYGNSLMVDKTAAYMGDGVISIFGKYKGQVSNVITITLPMPVRLRFPPEGQVVQLNTPHKILGWVKMRDSSEIELQSDKNSFKVYLTAKGPEGMAFTTYNGLTYPADKLYRPHTIDVCLNTEPKLCGKTRILPAYTYRLELKDNGRKGDEGSKGRSGSDGCASCSWGNNGTVGETGTSGYMGEDGSNMEIWLKTITDSVVLVRVNSKTYKNSLYYIDLKNGGSIDVFIHGGQGGQGGQGGRGGAGMDGSGSVDPGQGGNGGRGGTGGIGGQGGSLTVYTDAESAPLFGKIRVFNSGGEPGEGGEGGKPGRGGAKEGASLAGTLITGRRGEEGSTGERGEFGKPGPAPVHKIITY